MVRTVFGIDLSFSFVQLSEQISYGKLNLDAFTPYLYVFPTHNYLAKKEVSGLLAVFIIAIKKFTHHRINEEYECILIVLVLSYF